jgi:hypothetical protein
MRVRIVVTIAGIVLASSAWAQWNTQFIDNEGNAGKHCRIVNDLAGNPNAFYVTDNRAVHHAEWTGSGWSFEHVLATSYDVSEGGLDACIDRNGKWHVSVCDVYAGYDLHYATDASGPWRDTVLIHRSWAGYHVSIALDTAGLPHIADYCEYTDGLEHWWKTSGGSWQTETIESSTDIRWPSMAIDAQNHIYVGYYKSGDLMMAYHDASGWGTNVVDLPGDAGDYCSLKLDGSGKVCISYYDATNGDLKYVVGSPADK